MARYQILNTGSPLGREEVMSIEDEGQRDAPERLSDADLRTVARLVHAAVLASDGELRGEHGERTPEGLRAAWDPLGAEAERVVERAFEARGLDYEGHMKSSVTDLHAGPVEAGVEGNGRLPIRVRDELGDVADEIEAARAAVENAANGGISDRAAYGTFLVLRRCTERLRALRTAV